MYSCYGCVCSCYMCHVLVTCAMELVVCSCYRHTVFVQEYEVLSPHEELLLVLRGGPADLEVGWCRRKDRLTLR